MWATLMREKGRCAVKKENQQRVSERGSGNVKHVENCRVTFKIFNCNNWLFITTNKTCAFVAK